MLAVSCSTDDGSTESVSLELKSESVMRFSQEGGSGEINYTLKNAAPGAKLSVACVADWVTNISAGNVVTFDVAANDTTDERSAKNS